MEIVNRSTLKLIVLFFVVYKKSDKRSLINFRCLRFVQNGIYYAFLSNSLITSTKALTLSMLRALYMEAR